MSAVLERPADLRLDGVLGFDLPAALEAHEPPEIRGRGRDDVRLLVAERRSGALHHAAFDEIGRFLDPGDLLVVNVSATLPASLDGRTPTGDAVEVHLSTPYPAGLWIVELRRPTPAGTRPLLDARPGTTVCLPGQSTVELLAPAATMRDGVRLWIADLRLAGTTSVPDYLARHGHPIRYRHVSTDWGIDAYQTVFSVEPGSAEMPSAGRPFTAELVTGLAVRGVGVAPILLHTGVSSAEAHEPPLAEPYRVPADTAERVNQAHAGGHRVIAIGTTVVRALETVVDDRGTVHPGHGWTETIITPERGVRAVDGLLTGWHEPGASHLAMLEAVAGRELLERSYHAALEGRYLWHEFGDSHLILP